MVKWSSQNHKELESLQNAQKYLRKSSRVIAKIIELNKIVSGDKKFSNRKSQLNDILKHITDGEKVILTCNKKTLKESIYCDKKRLIEALQQIINNLTQLPETENSTMNIEVSVKNGSLILNINTKTDLSSKAVIKSIKTPSYKLGESLTSESSNERIEMAIAKAIIERHHGDLNYKNNAQKETRITIKIPNIREKIAV
jgi:K+-sensing histidine kinase KdpD